MSQSFFARFHSVMTSINALSYYSKIETVTQLCQSISMQVQSIYAINFDKRLYVLSSGCAAGIFVSFVNISISRYSVYLLLLHLECIQLRLQIVYSHDILFSMEWVWMKKMEFKEAKVEKSLFLLFYESREAIAIDCVL